MQQNSLPSAHGQNVSLRLCVWGGALQFLSVQNEAFYDIGSTRFFQIGVSEEISDLGLPTASEDFYQRDTPDKIDGLAERRLPRILNIGAGGEESRRMAAINTDMSTDGKPDIVCDARQLPFANNAFTVVRASHILEHIPQDQIVATLKDWRRVLHPQGELHIAVPDAEIVLREILGGETPKGQPAISFTQTTAPLAQIYGVGYENPETDPRWSHKIIFNLELLTHFLQEAGFSEVVQRTGEQDLASYCGVDDDSQNHCSLLITARGEKSPAQEPNLLTDVEFCEKCTEFIEKYEEVPGVSFVIPVYNEANNLPTFLKSLMEADSLTGQQREFIFALNGCTDNSEEVLREFLTANLDFHGKIIISEKGINQAFMAGIRARDLPGGLVGKLDADTFLHPHALDLLTMNIVENPELQVTYAEPFPTNEETEINSAEHHPPKRSERLYYHGRASLFRSNPLELLAEQKIPESMYAEDIFFSYLLAYYYGLGSMAAAPHAMVYGKTVDSIDDLAVQQARVEREIENLHHIFPPFRAIDQILTRQIFDDNYREISTRAADLSPKISAGWQQIASTK